MDLANPAPPELSLVIPALDEAAGILETLRVLQPLRDRGQELILVDGGSRDGTPELAAPLVERVLESPPGRARQMNTGARAARGRVLVFLHADTLLPADADLAIVAALSGSGNAPGRAPCWGRFDVRIVGRARLLWLVARMMNLRSRLTGIATGDQTIFCTRAAFDAVGGFPDQPLMEDIGLSVRLKRLSHPACLREKVLTSGRRWDTQGPWRTLLLMWRLRLDYWRGIPPERLAERYRG